MRYIFLILSVFILGCQQEKVNEVHLYNGAVIISMPEYIAEYPRSSTFFDDQLLLHKLYTSKDSSVMINVELRDKHKVNLRNRIAVEKQRLMDLNSKSIITKEEIFSVGAKEGLCVEYELPRLESDKERYLAVRLLYNTSSGLASIDIYCRYEDENGKVKGRRLLNEILKGIRVN